MLGNEKVEINRKKGYDNLAEMEIDDAITEEQPTKFVLEVTTGRFFFVFFFSIFFIA